MTALLSESVYRRATEPDQFPAGLRLRALEWAMLFAVDGASTVAELGRQVRCDAESCGRAMSRLLSLGLLVEQELDAAAYVRALAASGKDYDQSLQQFLAAAIHQPRRESEEAQNANADSHSPRSSISHALSPASPAVVPDQRERPKEYAQAVQPAVPERGGAEGASITPLRLLRKAAPVFGFRPLPTSAAAPKEQSPMNVEKKLSLRAFMDLIERRAGGREAGQLDIYRVFVRIDTALLKRNGISSLNFGEDRQIVDPELINALTASLRKTLGVDCPDSVWTGVA